MYQNWLKLFKLAILKPSYTSSAVLSYKNHNKIAHVFPSFSVPADWPCVAPHERDVPSPLEIVNIADSFQWWLSSDPSALS